MGWHLHALLRALEAEVCPLSAAHQLEAGPAVPTPKASTACPGHSGQAGLGGHLCCCSRCWVAWDDLIRVQRPAAGGQGMLAAVSSCQQASPSSSTLHLGTPAACRALRAGESAGGLVLFPPCLEQSRELLRNTFIWLRVRVHACRAWTHPSRPGAKVREPSMEPSNGWACGCISRQPAWWAQLPSPAC